MTDEQRVDNFRQRVATATALGDIASRVAIDIADAEAAMRTLDQQAERIAELEALCRKGDQQIEAANARIAELEADAKTADDLLSRWLADWVDDHGYQTETRAFIMRKSTP
jgi:hypothetical protein